MDKSQSTKSMIHFLDEFEKESERAKVILSAAMLDNALLAVLTSHFLPNATSNDVLFERPNAPLGSFSARIDFSYRLGLISKNFSRDLHIIRRIRNEFAHNITGCNFSTSSVSSRVATLKKSFAQLIEHEKVNRNELTTPVKQFQHIVAWIIFYLWQLSEKIECVKEAELEWGYMMLDMKKARNSEENSS